MTKSKSLVFFGTEDFSLSALKALVEHGYNVLCVVTKPDTKRGRGRKLSPPSVKIYAEENSIPVIQNASMNGIAKELANYPAEVAVLSAFGRIIPEELLEMYPVGIVNIHPSLLPRWRGASPIEQTILAGDKQAGVTLMKLVKEMDAGPVYVQKSIDLDGTENASGLYNTLGSLGANVLVESLPAIISGDLKAQEQDHSKATLAPMIKKEDGEIDWNDKAETIDRKVRAYVRWPGAKAELGEKRVKITNGYFTSGNSAKGTPSGSVTAVPQAGIIMVDTGSGSYCITHLKPDGKREMSSAEFMRGNKLLN